MSKRIDGKMLYGMIKNGYANLYLHEKEINDLNVFPVADGDTGVNMRLTLEHGLESAKRVSHAGAFLKSLSNGVLLGARGNSGVILSQIIKGWTIALESCPVVGIGEIRNAMIHGYRQAYASVALPVEGTVLTVAREGIENIRRQIGRSTSIETFLSMYIAEMKRILAQTPDMLDVLKEANVVDSGAKGYITIIEGMYKYLIGQKIDIPDGGEAVLNDTAADAEESEKALPFDSFDENSVFELGYCTEFVLRLLKTSGYRQDFDTQELIEFLNSVGNSTVCVKDGSCVKVHIHTHTPEKVIEYVRQFGEFLTIHIENMQLQHNERLNLKKEAEKKPLAVVTVVNGDALCEVFRGLGCDSVIDVGPNMNVSPSEFLSNISGLNAENIVILPNNKNTVSAAELAVSMYKGDAKLVVIPTASVIEGYCAVAMDVPDNPDIERRILQMKKGAEDVHTLAVAVATKDYTKGNVTAKQGQYIAIIDDAVVYSSDDLSDALLNGLSLHPDINDKNICLMISGEGTEDISDDIEVAVSGVFPDLDVNSLFGGQKLHSFIIGLI